MASTDSFHSEDRDADMQDQALECLSAADQRPGLLRGRNVGKPYIATVKKGQPDSATEKYKDSDYVLVTIEELDSKSPKSDKAEDQVQATANRKKNSNNPERSSSEDRPIQRVSDGDATVQAYSVRMAKMATAQLKDAHVSKALSDAAKSSLPERSRFKEADMTVQSVWSPESGQSEADHYGFEVREKYYTDEL
jgi:hypothetical protein